MTGSLKVEFFVWLFSCGNGRDLSLVEKDLEYRAYGFIDGVRCV